MQKEALIKLLHSLPESSSAINAQWQVMIALHQSQELSATIIMECLDEILKADFPLEVEYTAAIAYQVFALDKNNPEQKALLKKLHSHFDMDTQKIEDHLTRIAFSQCKKPDARQDGITEPTSLPSWFYDAKKELQCAEFYLLEDNFSLDGFDQEQLALEFKYLRSLYSYDDTNMLSNLFSLAGRMPDGQDLEGAKPNATTHFFAELMNQYAEECIKTQKYTKDILTAIDQVRQMTIKAMRFEFMMSTSAYQKFSALSRDEIAQLILKDVQTSGAEIFTGWGGHFVDIVLKENHLFRNNGGEHYIDSTTEEYEIEAPEKLTPNIITTLYSHKLDESNMFFIQRDLHSILGLKLTGKVDGKKQTEGNCSIHNKELGLQAKFRLFLPHDIADKITEDVISFMESRFLEEYCEKNNSSYRLHYILARLITYRLMPDKKLLLARAIIKNYFTTDHPAHHEESHDVIEILQSELMLTRWLTPDESKPIFAEAIEQLGFSLDPGDSPRMKVLNAFVNNTVDDRIWEIVKTLPHEKTVFLGFNLLHLAVRNDNPQLVRAVLAHHSDFINGRDFAGAYPLARTRSVEVAKILDEAGDSTKFDWQDGNALDHAISADNLPLVQHYIEVGAKPSHDSFRRVARSTLEIQQAFTRKYPEWLRLNQRSNSTLHYVSNPTYAKALIQQGCDPNYQNANGLSPFQIKILRRDFTTARFFMHHPCTLFKNPHRGDDVADWIKDDEFKHEFLQKRAEKLADLQAFNAFEVCDLNAGLEPHQLMVRAVQSGNLQIVRGCCLKYPAVDVNAIDETTGKSAHELAQDLSDDLILNYLMLLPGASLKH